MSKYKENVLMSLGKLLKGCLLFREIYDSEIEWMLKDCSIHYFTQDDFIIEEGQMANSLFIILEGEANLVKRIKGETFVLQVLRKGDLCGEMGLLEDRCSETDVQVLERTSVLKVPFDILKSTFKKRPEIYGLLMTNLCRMIFHNTQIAQKVIFRLQTEGQVKIRTPLYGQDRRRKWSKSDDS